MITLELAIRFSSPSSIGGKRQLLRTLLMALSLSAIFTLISLLFQLQEERIDLVKSTTSFPVVATTDEIGKVEKLYPGVPLFKYKEENVLLSGIPFSVRYIDEDYKGIFDLIGGNADALVLPLYRRGAVGDGEVSMLSLTGRRIVGEKVEVSGYYVSPNRSFDQMYAFLPYESAPEYLDTKVAFQNDVDVRLLDAAGISYETWKEKENVLYSALLLEAFLMIFVLLFLFMVVFLSLRKGVRDFLYDKRRERLSLSVMGLPKWKINLSFSLPILFYDVCSMILSVIFSLFLVKGAYPFIGLYGEGRISWGFVFSFMLFFIILRILDIVFLLHRMPEEVYCNE